MSLVSSDVSNIASKAASIIGNIADWDLSRPAVVESGAIECLVHLLVSDLDDVISEAARGIGIIAVGDTFHDKVTKTGCGKIMLRLLLEESQVY